MNIKHFKKATFASLMVMFVLMLLMAMIPLVAAQTMTAYGGSTPTIDGKWIGTEWDDANEYTVTGSGGTSYLRIKCNTTHLHIIIDSIWDTTPPSVYPKENAWVAFDPSHNDGGAPQTDDYLFDGEYSSWNFQSCQGNGTGWTLILTPAEYSAVSNASMSPHSGTTHRVEELAIPLTCVGSVGSTVGFYVMVVDDTTTNYVEWPTAAGGNPNGWLPTPNPCPAPSAWGNLKLTSGDIYAAEGSNPTIDGFWIGTEWDDANEYNVTGSGGTSYLRVKHNKTHLHILIDSPWDTTPASVFPTENTWTAFDTTHDGGAEKPKAHDYLFNSEYTDWNGVCWQGAESGWIPILKPSGYDAGQNMSTSPHSGVLHRVDEIEIPLTHVGKMDETCGFYVLVVDDTTTNYVEWPTAAGGNPAGWPPSPDPCPAPDAWGNLKLTSGDIYAAEGSNPTIDGFWIGTEWDDANEYNVTGSGGTSYLRVKHNKTHLHILIDSPWDTTPASVYQRENTWTAFDTLNDKSTGDPQIDDYLFNGEYTDWNGMCWQGNGSGWGSMLKPSGYDAGQNMSTSPHSGVLHRVDEIEIPLTHVLKDSYTCGFYVLVVDDTTTNYVEWPTAAGGNPAGWPPSPDPCPAPDAWGNLRLEVPIGDVNGDGLVDIVDIVIVALAFGSEPGDPNWNPFADRTLDGIIDIVDIVTVAIYFGNEYH